MSRLDDELPTGFPLPSWTGCEPPIHESLDGLYCALEPLNVSRHAGQLWDAHRSDPQGLGWTYLGTGPFADFESYRDQLALQAPSEDPMFFAVVDKATSRAVGIAAFLRIDPPAGVVEIGHIHFSPPLQRTPAATEALFCLMRHVFEDLGYRRCEWKCDNLNAASHAAARRLGFSFEGVFRQATVVKGRNRDTAWYSILDREWPALARGFRAWLAQDNFDETGVQRRRLAELRP